MASAMRGRMPSSLLPDAPAELEEIALDPVDPVVHTVHSGVCGGHGQTRGVQVAGNHTAAVPTFSQRPRQRVWENPTRCSIGENPGAPCPPPGSTCGPTAC